MKDYFELPCYGEKLRFTKAVITHFNPIRIPIPFWDATGGPFLTNAMECWLELYDEDGIMGQMLCTTEMARCILPLIMTGEKKTYQEWYNLVYWANRNRGFSSEAFVELGRLDFALHDIMAKRAGVPLHRLLGAERDWVAVYASGCGTHLTDAETEKEVSRFLEGGYTVFKMKAATDFGADLNRDIRRIAKVREMIGPDRKLAVDVNQLWKAGEALEFAKRIEPYDIYWYEEPVHSHDMEELEKLTKQCSIPISMGESMRNRYLFYTYAQAGVKHLQPVSSNMCSISDWMYVRNLAKERDLMFTSGGYGHVTASLIATADEDAMVEYLYPIHHYVWELMELRPEEKNGRFYLPDVPGMPISPDWKLLENQNLIAGKEYFFPQK